MSVPPAGGDTTPPQTEPQTEPQTDQPSPPKPSNPPPARGVLAATVVVVGLAAIALVWMLFGENTAAVVVAIGGALAGMTAVLWRWLEHRSARITFVVCAVAATLVASGALWILRPPGEQPSSQQPLIGEGTLRVLAGRSLIDALRPVLDRAKSAINVTVQLDQFEGSLAMTEKVLSGELDGKYDAFWLPSNRYLTLHAGQAERYVVGSGEPIATSPVILGLREADAQRLGWHERSPSWSEIADAAQRGDFTYAMTKPHVSNSGFATLMAVAAALATGGQRELKADDIEPNIPRLQSFFRGQVLTSGSSGHMRDMFIGRAEEGQPVNGIFSYESELLNINAKLPSAPLRLVYPSDGTNVADYPITLLKSANQRAKQNFDALVNYLRHPEIQRELLQQANLRPMHKDVAIPPTMKPVRQLPFAADLEAARRLVRTFESRLRNPARTIYVLDLSGSMCFPAKGKPPSEVPRDCEGPRPRRIDELTTAFKFLAGANPSGLEVPLSRDLARFAEGEEVILLPFSSTVQQPTTFAMTPLEQRRGEVIKFVDGLKPSGATHLYEALIAAYRWAEAHPPAASSSHLTSIVLLSDGEPSGDPYTYGHFKNHYCGLVAKKSATALIPVYPVMVGESPEATMRDIAGLTQGHLFDGRTTGGTLEDVFVALRADQFTGEADRRQC